MSILSDQTRPVQRWLARAALSLTVSAGLLGSALADTQRSAFRVCADPNYLPYSSRSGEGFENKLAEILAQSMDLPVTYTWFPQRMGFIRNTLRAKDPQTQEYKCDVVMGVPDRYELAVTTDPYYESTYVLVYLKDSKRLGQVHSGAELLGLSEDQRYDLRIGVTERSPGARWLAKHGMYGQIAAYIAQSGDPDEYPDQPIQEDLLAGRIDAAILWGPIAGYLARRAGADKVVLVPLQSEPGVRFNYAIAAGVRFGDNAWRDQLNELLKQNSAQIAALLEAYNVPAATGHGASSAGTADR